jgi:ferritin-like metal-binding protein YciE
VSDLPAGTVKLIQYLNEAYGTERRLEVALQAHIGLATRRSYKNRLREHLTETKRHAREVSKRIKQLGGVAETIDLPVPDPIGVAQIAVGVGQRAAALAQGPLHALRGTGEEEKQLKNAKTEYASEAEEIATYNAIISAAEAIGDQETVKLARAILREEQRMAAFLEREIPRMAAAVVIAEVPRSERAPRGRSRRRRASARTRQGASASSSRKAASSTRASKASTSRSRKKAGSTLARKASSSRARKAASSTRKASSSARRGTSSPARSRRSSAARSRTSSPSSSASGRRGAAKRGATSAPSRRTPASPRRSETQRAPERQTQAPVRQGSPAPGTQGSPTPGTQNVPPAPVTPGMPSPGPAPERIPQLTPA